VDRLQQWFLNGHHWTLGILRLCGVDVDEVKLQEILQELRDGSLSTMDTLTERIEDIGPHAEQWGVPLSAEDVKSIADTIRSAHSVHRGVARERDKECASLILDFQEGRWPKLDSE
jgi:hypothetical protein